MAAGIGLMILGFLAMMGGGYTDVNTPNYDVKYGFRTTILAPMLVLAGLFVNGMAIMKKPSEERVNYVMNEVFTEKKVEKKARTESAKRLRKEAEPSREEVKRQAKEEGLTRTEARRLEKEKLKANKTGTSNTGQSLKKSKKSKKDKK